MDNRTRFLIGGIGGLAPVLIFLVNLDLERYFVEATMLKTAGYLLRTVVLFLIGGFVAYLHDTEDKKFTIFLLGIAAPSLIAGYLSTANQNYRDAGSKRPDETKLSLFLPIPSAQAQTTPSSGDLKRFTLPPQSRTSEFLDGFLGRSPNNVWFVIAGSHLDPAEAKKQAKLLNAKYPEFKAEVYAPYGDNPYYAVVIGAHLTQSEARQLTERARRAGLTRDTYFKTFSGLPSAH